MGVAAIFRWRKKPLILTLALGWISLRSWWQCSNCAEAIDLKQAKRCFLASEHQHGETPHVAGVAALRQKPRELKEAR